MPPAASQQWRLESAVAWLAVAHHCFHTQTCWTAGLLAGQCGRRPEITCQVSESTDLGCVLDWGAITRLSLSLAVLFSARQQWRYESPHGRCESESTLKLSPCRISSHRGDLALWFKKAKQPLCRCMVRELRCKCRLYKYGQKCFTPATTASISRLVTY